MVRKLVLKYDDTFQRIFELTPGLLIWLLLTAPVWLGKTLPAIAADLVVLLTVYWVYKAAEMALGLVIGYNKYRQAVKTDWLEECLNLDRELLPQPETLPQTSELPKHMIVIPNGGARYDTLKNTLDKISDQNYPKELVYIVISTEQRLFDKDPEYFADMHRRIKEDYAEYGDRIIITLHPPDLPDEVPGAASNRSWGTRIGVETMEERGEIISDFLITSPDEDLQFQRQYLAAISYQYLIAEKRQQKFYQTALYLFNNNYWQVPMLVRTFAVGVSLAVLSSSAINMEKRETWSCYTVNLDVMKKVDYWDRTISIDDTPFYWRPFFYFKGDFSCRVFYIPLSADAVYHDSYVQNHRAQYKQLLRWGWGVITVPIALQGLLTRNDIPLSRRIGKIIHLFDVFVLWKVMAFVITFGAPIIFAVSSEYTELVISHSMPQTLSTLLLLALIFLLPSTVIKILISPPTPSDWPIWKSVLFIAVEIPINLVVLLTYNFLPFIEASTRMMFGETHGFVITQKKAAK